MNDMTPEQLEAGNDWLESEAHTHDMIECPKHEGNFDCNPFCSTCEGEQEYCQTCDNARPCASCGTPVPTDIHAEELGFCIPCQHEYFDNKETN